MPVPALITALSTTAGSNSPSSSESTITVDDYIRALSAFIAQLRDGGAFTGTITPSIVRLGGATQGFVGTRTSGGSGLSASSACDDIVIDSGIDAGLSVLSGAANFSRLAFGTAVSPTSGRVQYDNAAQALTLWASNAEAVRVATNGNVSIGRTSDGAAQLVVDRIGTGTIPALNAGTVAAFVGCAVAGSTSSVSLIAGNAGASAVYFGDTDAEDSARISYNHSSEIMTIGVGGATALTVDSGEIVSNVRVIAPAFLSNAQQIGYAVGAGGTVTQATSKSTAVTLNKPAGRITMHPANLAAGAVVSFTLNCSPLNQFTLVAINIRSGAATGGSYAVSVDNIDVGTCRVNVQNLTAGTLGEALVLSFVLIEGSDS